MWICSWFEKWTYCAADVDRTIVEDSPLYFNQVLGMPTIRIDSGFQHGRLFLVGKSPERWKGRRPCDWYKSKLGWYPNNIIQLLQAGLDRSNFDRWPSKFRVPRPGTPCTLDTHIVSSKEICGGHSWSIPPARSMTWRRSSMLGLVCLQLGMMTKVGNGCAQRTHGPFIM